MMSLFTKACLEINIYKLDNYLCVLLHSEQQVYILNDQLIILLYFFRKTGSKGNCIVHSVMQELALLILLVRKNATVENSYHHQLE